MVSNKDMNICNFFSLKRKKNVIAYSCIHKRGNTESTQRGDMQSTNSHGTVEGRKIE